MECSEAHKNALLRYGTTIRIAFYYDLSKFALFPKFNFVFVKNGTCSSPTDEYRESFKKQCKTNYRTLNSAYCDVLAAVGIPVTEIQGIVIEAETGLPLLAQFDSGLAICG